MVVQGLSWPDDRGDWVPLVAGRPLRQAHYEMIADQSLRLPLGSRIRLGKDVYEVVGLTRGMVGTSGDGLSFFTVSDAMAIQFDEPGEAVRLERAARRARVESMDLGRLQPLLLERAAGLSSGIPAFAPPQVSAVLVTLQPGADEAAVRRTLATWPDITVYSTQEQKDLLLSGMVDKARRQLGLFRALLIIISTIIMALIIYTLTLDKIHDIALLKLIGARNGVIVGLILQQALLMGALGYGLAWWIGQYAFPHFPRLVVIDPPDLASLALIVVGISTLASLLGIWKAMRVEPNKVSPHERPARQHHACDRGHAPPQSLWQRPHRGRGHARCLAARRARRNRRPARPQRRGQVHAAHRDRPDQSADLRPDRHRRQARAGWTAALVDLRAFRRQHLGFVFQKANLIPFLTALENVQIALEINDTAPQAARQRALELLDYLGVGAARQQSPRRALRRRATARRRRPRPGQRAQPDPRRRTHRRARQPASAGRSWNSSRKSPTSAAPASSSSRTITARSTSSTVFWMSKTA